MWDPVTVMTLYILQPLSKNIFLVEKRLMHILKAPLAELHGRRYFGLEEGIGSVCVPRKSGLLKPYLCRDYSGIL